jgi:2-C-methyl-D-erythritol 2,4-cyclodiphosphate synthase
MNADSRKLLSQVVSLLNKHNYQVVNLDATLICQTPKLRPFIDVMRTNLASDLATDISNLSVKATTEEGLGISGAGGIAAHCVVLLEERKP